MGSLQPPLPKRAWVTLVTRASYLPGAILLAYSLQKFHSAYPLLILTTPSFPSSLLTILKAECDLSNSIHFPITPLSPPPHNLPQTLIAERFADTWTKLRVFELWKFGCEKLVFLDADMLVRKNMDELFDVNLERDWIAANHVCVCNLDHDAWAPKSWMRENCAYTKLLPGDEPTPVPKEGEGKETHTLLNSGLFIFQPFEQQWDDILKFLWADERVKNFLFPDQDFLAEFFRGRWKSLGWEVNALKTWRYWHPEMWNDDEVKNVHYIVDKPWSKRVGRDGVAGYLGNDSITHQWWWEEFANWERERNEMGERAILEVVRKEAAPPLEDEQRNLGVIKTEFSAPLEEVIRKEKPLVHVQRTGGADLWVKLDSRD
jgi:inositol 3-alpha-galactosyltransferase